jgi:hypothetical protein
MPFWCLAANNSVFARAAVQGQPPFVPDDVLRGPVQELARAWLAFARPAVWKNVRTKRTMRTKSLHKGTGNRCAISAISAISAVSAVSAVRSAVYVGLPSRGQGLPPRMHG